MPAVATDDYDVSIYNIVAHQGSTFKRTIIFKDSDGVAINLGTGPSAQMKVRKSYPATLRAAAYRDVHVLYFSDTGTGGTSTNAITFDAANGKIIINVPAATMAGAPAGIYNYDLELTLGTSPGGNYAAGDVVKIIAGLFEIKQEMTY